MRCIDFRHKKGQIQLISFNLYHKWNGTGQEFWKKDSIFRNTVELGDKELFGHPKIVPYPYEVNWQLAMRNGSLKFIFSMKATRIDKIFTADLTFTRR